MKLKPFSERNRKIINGITENKKMANGYIFYGVPGSFMSDAAVYFASAANCQVCLEGFCGKCHACRSISRNNYADLIYIDPQKEKSLSGNITIDQVREIKELVKYGPNSGKYLFVVIRNCQKFTVQAANAFLKVLEEPLPGVCFILITKNVADVLPTIKSRCQLMFFPKAGHNNVMDYLYENYSEEELKEINQKTYNNEYLLNVFLEEGYLVGEGYITCRDILNKDKFARLEIVQNLIKDKHNAQTLLMIWIQEIWNDWQNLSEKDYTILDKLIENTGQMKYNVNLRLHLENLLICL
ncbi:MAG: hypothetical protein GY730_00660 [bacterium]|nr:hypothetical protein [bacterium]